MAKCLQSARRPAGEWQIQPFRPDDLNILLDEFADTGEGYRGVAIAKYKGYNELVVQSASWVANLPESIEAFFYLDCEGLLHNALDYVMGGGLATNCEEAEDYTRAAYTAYV